MIKKNKFLKYNIRFLNKSMEFQNDQKRILVNNKLFKVIVELGKGKSGVSYLCYEGNKLVTLKQIKVNESNYIPFEEAINKEIESYKVLMQIGIRIPRLIEYDIVNKCIVKEFINGETIINLVAKDKINKDIWDKIFRYSKMAYKFSVNLDYFPTNYIYTGNEVYYIDYEVHNYSVEWNFENWGIYYWVNNKGVKKYLETGDGKTVHISNMNYRPVTNSLIEKRRIKVIKQYRE